MPASEENEIGQTNGEPQCAGPQEAQPASGQSHTPGPWEWWTSCSWRRLRHDDERGRTVSVVEPFVCRDGHPDLIVSEADMALIAAAPETYEALKDILRTFSADGESFTDEDYSDALRMYGSDVAGSLDHARAAIDRAEGR